MLIAIAFLSACQSQAPTNGRTGLEATQSSRTPFFGTQNQQPGMQGRREISLLTPQTETPQTHFEPQGDKVTLNLVNTPIPVVAKVIFADILKSNFSVADGVAGNVTIQTARPTSKQALVDIFETILNERGYGIEKKGGAFHVSGTDQIRTGSIGNTDASGVSAGRQARIVPLNYISAKQMADIIKAYAPEGVLQTDDRRNIIVLRGNNAEIEGMLSSIKLFDVDWMRGMSASLFPLDSGADPTVVVKQLQSLFAASTSGDGDTGVVKFLPSRELKAILVIAQRPAYLARARSIIARLDDAASYGTRQTFVYRVQNRNSKDLASVLQRALGSGGITAAVETSQTAEGDTQQSSSALALASQGTGLGSDVSVVADESNNSLVIVAS